MLPGNEAPVSGSIGMQGLVGVGLQGPPAWLGNCNPDVEKLPFSCAGSGTVKVLWSKPFRILHPS